MAAYLGFDRRIALAWLDETAGQLLHDPDPIAVQAHLHTYLAAEVQGLEARVKTITLLCRIWVKPLPVAHLHDEALLLLPTLLPADRLWLHWGRTLLVLPFFRDVAATVGRLLSIQGECSVGQVTDRMIATWGERSTLVRATQRVLRSCVEWGALQEGLRRGTYHASLTRQTTSTVLRDWFLDAALRAHQTDGVPAAELIRLPETYPFATTIPPYELARLLRFEVEQQGSGVVMVYPSHVL